MPKSEDLSRSLEINAIWTFDTEFPTINKSCTYITFSSPQLNTDNWVTATLGDRLSMHEAGYVDSYLEHLVPLLKLDINILSILHYLGSPLG